MTDASPIKKSGFEVTEDLKYRFDVEAKRRKLKLKEAIRQAIESWLAAGTKSAPVLEPVGKKESGKAPLPFGHSPWHSKLQHILDSGSEDAIEAVTRNLDVFYDYVVLREREPAAGKSVPGAGAQKAAQPGGTETADPKHGQDLRKRKPGSA